MVYEFTYSAVISRCKMLASFEGRDYTGDSGESLFLRVKLTEQDEPLLLSYLEEAARRIEERVARMVSAGWMWGLEKSAERRMACPSRTPRSPKAFQRGGASV